VLLKALGTGVAAIGVGFSISAVLVGCYEVSDKRRTTIAESILLAVALLLFQGWRFTLLTLSLTLGPYWLGWAWAYLRWRGATMQTLKPIDLLPVPWRWWGYSIALWWLLAAVVVWGRQWGWLG
jgi:hypothetical protein